MRKNDNASGIIRLQTEEEKIQRMKTAADKLYDDYLNDPELTALSGLDSEDFFTSYPTQIERI